MLSNIVRQLSRKWSSCGITGGQLLRLNGDPHKCRQVSISPLLPILRCPGLAERQVTVDWWVVRLLTVLPGLSTIGTCLSSTQLFEIHFRFTKTRARINQIRSQKEKFHIYMNKNLYD